ncbi:MAG TPA: hypothetical protein VGR71_16520, partial [Nitrospira sp.]|nr:hypothetical protein [Nitrospira sp.]
PGPYIHCRRVQVVGWNSCFLSHALGPGTAGTASDAATPGPGSVVSAPPTVVASGSDEGG